MSKRPDWLKPPRTLLLFLFTLTLVSVSSLIWFGWKLLEQERLVEAQRSQERLEQSADRMAANLRRTIFETTARLGTWRPGEARHFPIQPELLLQIRHDRITAEPAERLLYYPGEALPEALQPLFTQAEMFEFAQDQPAEALRLYRQLAANPSAGVRAGALLRQARVLRRLNRPAEAIPLYHQLANFNDATVAGIPADLAALAEIAALTHSGTRQLQHDLSSGRWRLSRGQFLYFWSQAAASVELPEPAATLSEVVQQVYRSPNQATIWANHQPFSCLNTGTPGNRAVLLVRPSALLPNQDIKLAIVDAEGRTLAGTRDVGTRAVIRTAAESQLPWTLYFSAPPSQPGAHLSDQQRFLLWAIAIMIVFLLLGTYFIARAIRREADLARLQSDFVSAVSHEFRSPLTTMRQLSEILLLGRVPSEERRQLYYTTLVQETTRLQRVVESLLHFGSMEAGKRQYRLEECDPVILVRQVAAEMQAQLASTAPRILCDYQTENVLVAIDPDAFSVALRNLLDNAIKYSPGQRAVWIDVTCHDHEIAIAVRDHGLGITDIEKRSIFQKFVRGSAATAGNVKGSGVGLAMVRHIVDAHRGAITVDSKPGVGSTFTIHLPALEIARERTPAQ